MTGGAAPQGLDMGKLGRTLEAHLERAGLLLRFRDRATGKEHDLERGLARDPASLLPVFLAAGEAVWHQATGKPGFGLDIRPDAQALFGRRLHRVGAGTFNTVMLSTMEAVDMARRMQVVMVNDLREQWAAFQSHPLAASPAGSPGLRSEGPRRGAGAQP